MTVLLLNNIKTTLSAEITDEQMTITVADGSLFPSPVAGEEEAEWFPVVIENAAGQYEIMHATARAENTITVDRGAEGTQRRAFDAGSAVEIRLTVQSLTEFILNAGGSMRYLQAQKNLSDVDSKPESRSSLSVYSKTEIQNLLASHVVEFRASDGYIQWRYKNRVDWNNIIALADISGADGTDGTSAAWLNGAGVPDAANGNDGDMYLRTDNGDIYRKEEGVWNVKMNIDGDAGIAGGATRWYTGASSPTNTLGVEGDLYLNTTSGDVAIKTSSGWVIENNILGAAGTQWFTGENKPDSTVEDANDGDLYIATGANVLGNVYKKTSGAWSLLTNLTGPSGADGAAGRTNLVLTVGEVGTYIMARSSDGTTFNVGDRVSGYNLVPSNAGGAGDTSITLTGTWQCMGYIVLEATAQVAPPAIWLRVA